MKKPGRALMILLLLLIFTLVISINFFKPFGFFRESNPAMVCINANYWNQNAGLKEHRIPIESYSFDPKAKPETQLWATVTSFGYGWFLIPYSFFSFLHLQPGEISIRIFSLFWLAFTLLTACLLCRRLTGNNSNSLAVTYLTAIFYLFNASVLWYHVQGYVHEIAVLPFYFLSWLFFLKFIEEASVKWLTALGACLFIAVQFDWLPCFQAGVMTVYFFIRRRKIQNNFAFLWPALSVVFGIAWIIYTYSKWATLPVYAGFLKEKFMSRTIGSGGLQVVHGLNYNFNLVLFYVTGYGLLSILFLWGILKNKLNTVVWLMIISAILHHIVFWGFSTEHDHAVVKMAFPVAFTAAVVISPYSIPKQIALSCLVIIVNIAIYFFLHNFYTRKGMYTNPYFCYDTGKTIRQKLSANNQFVFVNTQGKYLLQIEFYAGKPYTRAASIEEARQILHEKYPGGTGYFIDGEKGIANVTEFK